MIDNKKYFIDTLSNIEIKFLRRRLFEPFCLHKDLIGYEEEAVFKSLKIKKLLNDTDDYFGFDDEIKQYFAEKYLHINLNLYYYKYDENDMKDKYIEYLLETIKNLQKPKKRAK